MLLKLLISFIYNLVYRGPLLNCREVLKIITKCKVDFKSGNFDFRKCLSHNYRFVSVADRRALNSPLLPLRSLVYGNVIISYKFCVISFIRSSTSTPSCRVWSHFIFQSYVIRDDVNYLMLLILGQHLQPWRMVSFGLIHRVALVRTDVSEEPDASFIRVTKIGELGTTQTATSNRRTLRSSSETSVLTRATRRNNPEDTILQSHRRENLKSYIIFNIFDKGAYMCV
jgi:hypothetical protein